MKRVLITQSNYIPWKGYFDAINYVDHVVLYDDMQFTKRDWRNRNKVKTPQGTQWLSVPVEVSGKYLQKINETVVADSKWGEEHWKTICQNYRKTPFFKNYAPIFERLYLNPVSKRLSDINHSFLIAVMAILGIDTKVSSSSEFNLIDGKTERLVNICSQLGATDYYSGPAAKNYIDTSLFKGAEINVNFLDYSNYPDYPQRFPPFVHDVSILDVLFNCGDSSRDFVFKISKDL